MLNFTKTLRGKIMIQSFEANELEALVYGVLEKFFARPVFGAIPF